MTDEPIIRLTIDPAQRVSTPLAKALIDAKDDRTTWIWQPWDDWKGPEARAIRNEIFALTDGDYWVKFAGWTLEDGRKGTRLQLHTRAEYPKP